VSVFLTNCATPTDGGTTALPNQNHAAVKARDAEIALEPRGDYFVGRRWWTEGTRFWGYLRRPGQPWSEAALVLMYEGSKKTPDRLPEESSTGLSHGYDHNYEYRIYGKFMNKVAYDPNSNLELPVFYLTGYEVVDANPGFLFFPGEPYSKKRLPPKVPTSLR